MCKSILRTCSSSDRQNTSSESSQLRSPHSRPFTIWMKQDWLADNFYLLHHSCEELCVSLLSPMVFPSGAYVCASNQRGVPLCGPCSQHSTVIVPLPHFLWRQRTVKQKFSPNTFRESEMNVGFNACRGKGVHFEGLPYPKAAVSDVIFWALEFITSAPMHQFCFVFKFLGASPDLE